MLRSIRRAGPARAFALLATVQFTLIMAIGILTLALPALSADLGLSAGELALAATAYGMAFTGLLLLGGRLADQLGHRRVFVLGTTVFALASGGAAAATGIGTLVAARFVQGAAAALTAPAGMALIGSVFREPGARTRAVAAWGGLSSAGATVGTLLGGGLAELSWRWTFAVPCVVAGLAAVVAGRLLPPGPPPAATRLDVPGAVLVTAALCALSYGLVATVDRGWTDPLVLVSLAAGAALLTGFVAVESRTPEPLVPLRFLASPRRVTGLSGVLMAAAGAATVGYLLSLYLQQIRGWSSPATAAAFLPYFLVLATALLAGPLIARTGVRPVTVAGLAVAAAGLLLLGRLDVDTGYAATLLPGLALVTVGLGLTFAGATVAAVDGASRSQAGLAGGVLNTAMEAGPTVGLALLVSLAAAQSARLADAGTGAAAAVTGGYGLAFSVAGVAFAVLAATAARTLSH